MSVLAMTPIRRFCVLTRFGASVNVFFFGFDFFNPKSLSPEIFLVFFPFGFFSTNSSSLTSLGSESSSFSSG